MEIGEKGFLDKYISGVSLVKECFSLQEKAVEI